jgi:glutamate carboxypeptidase
VVARKGSARFTLRIHGRPAHSGSHPERGASAIVEMADKIVKIAGLADYDRGVTTNVGTVRGGTVVNTVPAYAEALIDLRARDAASFEAAKQSIRQVCAESIVRSRSDGFACRLELEEHPDYPPMPRNRATDRLFEWAREDSEAVGAAVEPQERGGASDASHVCALAPTIDGLGPVGDHAHSSQPGRQEFILRSSLVPRALLAASLLSRIAG